MWKNRQVRGGSSWRKIRLPSLSCNSREWVREEEGGSCMFWEVSLSCGFNPWESVKSRSHRLACRVVPGLRLDVSVVFGKLLTSVSKVTTFRLSKESKFYFLNAQQWIGEDLDFWVWLVLTVIPLSFALLYAQLQFFCFYFLNCLLIFVFGS